MKTFYLIAGLVAASAAFAIGTPLPQDSSDNLLDMESGLDSVSYTDTDSDSIVMPIIESVSDFFLFSDELDNIDASVRMDMLDYYASGMRKRMSTRLDGEAVIDSIASDSYMKVITSSVSETEVQKYTDQHTNSFFGVIQRVRMPATDSRIYFIFPFRAENMKETLIPSPSATDFIVCKDKALRKDLIARIDFPLVDYHFMSNGDVEARLSMDGYLSREDSAATAPYIREKLVYTWNGKKFALKK